MDIQVEFFGIPRLRAGTGSLSVPAPLGSLTLGELLAELGATYPELAASCFPGGELAAECAVSIDGSFFTRDAAVLLQAGQSLLMMSADAGG